MLCTNAADVCLLADSCNNSVLLVDGQRCDGYRCGSMLCCIIDITDMAPGPNKTT